MDLKDLIGRAVHQVAMRATDGAKPVLDDIVEIPPCADFIARLFSHRMILRWLRLTSYRSLSVM